MRELTAVARLAWAALRFVAYAIAEPFRRPVMRAESGGETRLLATAPGQATIDEDRRTVEGLIVPFGPDGQTSMGRFTFGPGAIDVPERVGRVKLLTEHDQRESVGVALNVDQVDAAEADRRLVALGREPMGLAGLWGRYHVPEGPEGDRALAGVRNGTRDAFSVGVALHPDAILASRRAGGRAVPGRGRLRETSLVAVPAFEDAAAAAASSDPQTLVVAAWHDEPTNTGRGPTVEPCQTCGHNHAAGTPCSVANAATAAPVTTPAPVATATAPNPPVAPAGPVVADSGAAGGPTPVVATAGMTTVTREAAVYTFDGNGPSFVRDSFRAREDGDAEAAARLGRFSAELRAGEGPTAALMLAAVETRATAPEVLQPERFDSTRFMSVVDRGRPMFARFRNVTVTDATPFRLPIEGEFDGVGVHTEGTAHVPEGTLTLDDAVVSPSAISGAYRVSRELVDASNPAIDRVALNAMTRDYRNATEDLVAAALGAVGTETASIDTVGELRTQLILFAGTLGVPADVVLASTTAFAALAGDVDGDGRPMLPYVGPTNASGTIRAGYTGASIDGVEVATAHRLDAGDIVIAEGDGIMVGESSLLTFRFDQPEGPGIIKLALWAYAFAAVIRADSVMRLRTGA